MPLVSLSLGARLGLEGPIIRLERQPSPGTKNRLHQAALLGADFGADFSADFGADFGALTASANCWNQSKPANCKNLCGPGARMAREGFPKMGELAQVPNWRNLHIR